MTRIGMGSWILGMLAVAAGLGCDSPAAREVAATEPAYPEARRSDHVDTYHGVRVADPYRWMEDEDSPETVAWVEAQDRLFEGRFDTDPLVQRIESAISGIQAFERYGMPMRRGERYFVLTTAPGAKYPVLSVQTGLDGKPRRVLDFNEAIEQPDHGVGGVTPSPDGKTVVWSSQAPTRWGWLEIAAVDSGKRIDGKIDGVASGFVIWTHDNAGFYYQRYGTFAGLQDGATPHAKLHYHRLGTPQAEDRLVFAAEREGQVLSPRLSNDGRYLVLGLLEGTSTVNRVQVLDLRSPDDGWKMLIGEADAAYTFEANDGRRFLFQTTLDAPRGRVIAIDLDHPARQSWTEVIPERKGAIGSVSHIGDRLVLFSTVDARPTLEVFGLDGKRQRAIELPALGLLSGLGDDPGGNEAFISMQTLYDPGTIYRVDLKSGKSRVFRRPDLRYDPDRWVTRQVFYTSKDGTRVPMLLVHPRDFTPTGDTPLFMYGYGHGGWMAAPWYQPHMVAWLELGGIYALPGLRGGGEYGAEWQAAGTRRNKQNTIDDFIAAAEWLIEQKYTSARKLVANGGSASGVLPAAAVAQRPDLFGASLIEFPFLDMMRYHEFTVIKGWTGGYGSVESKDDFAVLRSYSPLHNLEAGRCYPATLTVVAGEDTSTVPMHGYKYTAALQQVQGCPNPVMLKSIPGVGHYSYGSDRAEQAHNQARIIAFLAEAVGMNGASGTGKGD